LVEILGLTSACNGQSSAVTHFALRSKIAASETLLVEAGVSFRKRPKRIKGGVVKVVNKEIQRTSRWLSTVKAG
jgi:hypothetical protein